MKRTRTIAIAALMLALPPLAVLAAFALPTLQSGPNSLGAGWRDQQNEARAAELALEDLRSHRISPGLPSDQRVRKLDPHVELQRLGRMRLVPGRAVFHPDRFRDREVVRHPGRGPQPCLTQRRHERRRAAVGG